MTVCDRGGVKNQQKYSVTYFMDGLDLPGSIQAARLLPWMAINGGKKPMLVASPHVPQKRMFLGSWRFI